ncbi:MAG: hypothetical protein WC135_06685 [Bacteroidales bacterium]
MKKLVILLLMLICTTANANNEQYQEVNSGDITMQINQLTINSMQDNIKKLEKDIEILSERQDTNLSIYKNNITLLIIIAVLIFAQTAALVPLFINKRNKKRLNEMEDDFSQKIVNQEKKIMDLFQKIMAQDSKIASQNMKLKNQDKKLASKD